MTSISVLGGEEEVEAFLTSRHAGRDISEEYQKDSVVYTNIVVVQLLSCVQFFVTLAAHQASLSFTVSQSLLKLMSTVLVMPSSHLILSHPLLLLPSIFSGIGVFPVNWFFASSGQRIGVSASALVLPMNIQS